MKIEVHKHAVNIASSCSYYFPPNGRKLRIVSSGMLRRVALVRTAVSEELSASFIRATRIGELETTLALTSNRRTPRRNRKCVGC
jgi:hypothetical protein